MAARADFIAGKSYRLRFQNGQELDCKFCKSRESDPDMRLKFVLNQTGTLRVYPFDIEIVSEIPDISFVPKDRIWK
jgi:hypothetical protein